MNIGIMGGTFDPIHYGHLVVAEEARVKFNLLKVIFVPSGQPPHKKDYEITSSEERYNMVKIAIKSNPYFEVSRMEIERGGLSYTIDTVKEFKKIYKDAQIFFITGLDAILEILTWKNKEELTKLCYFISASRPGYRITELKDKIGKEFLDVTYTLEVPALAISSSDIRARVKNNQPIRYLLPDEVMNYIYEKRLYL